MDKQFVDAIRSLAIAKDEPIVFMAENGAKAVPFSPDLYSPVEKRPGRILFVDGGSQIVIDAPSFKIGMVRIYWALFDGSRKIKRQNVDLDVIINENIQVFPKGDFSHIGGTDLDAFRRLAELTAATKAITLLEKGDTICIDGSLCPKDDRQILIKLAQACEAQGIALIGLSKTSEMLAQGRNPPAQLLSRIAPHRTWRYFPCQEYNLGDQTFASGFAKLHPRADYVLRFDAKTPEAIDALATQSRDPSFLGYPYGLIDADTFARISFREVEAKRLLLKSKLPRFQANDAHGVLDAINATKKFK